MKLRELLGTIGIDHPALENEVTGISTNSQTCQPGDLFIGMPGSRVDGGEFWPGALQQGAVAALVSVSAIDKVVPHGEPVFSTPDTVQACAQIAAQFYGQPASKLRLVGVTGTNGKTTTTHLIEFLLQHSHKPTALMGTLYVRWQNHLEVALNTTLFADQLHSRLAEAVAAGNQYAVIEVSSHALSQGRVLGCPFEAAVFTNLTQDHLDFHRTMEDYFQAKALLFGENYLKGRAIVNLDDEYGQRLAQTIPPPQLWTYSLDNPLADLHLSNVDYTASGVSGQLHTPQGTIAFTSPLVGQFNLQNLMAAVGACLHLGVELALIAEVLPQFAGVPGRVERVQVSPQQDISVVVDYAHTPDGLENLLRATRPFVPGRLICVFGCGGDRDRTKRPLMGEIAARLADIVVVTSDNPRTEDPERILEDILTGISPGVSAVVEVDRAKAIQIAIAQAQRGDGVIIAGKGHEDYQILGTERVPFDDRLQARLALEQRYPSPSG